MSKKIIYTFIITGILFVLFNVDVYAETPSEITDSWDTIISNVKSGNASKYKVGDYKEVDLGTYGTHTLRVANNSRPTECETQDFSQTACGFVLEFSDIITTHDMNPVGIYKGTQYNKGWNVDGWPVTSMRTFVNTDIYNELPSNLKNAIIETSVVSGHGSTSGETNFVTTDKLYLLSVHEVWTDVDGRKYIGMKIRDTSYNNTRQLDYYYNISVTSESFSGAIKYNGTIASHWWLRSAHYNGTDYFCMAYKDGTWNTMSPAKNNNGVSPAFRLDDLVIDDTNDDENIQQNEENENITIQQVEVPDTIEKVPTIIKVISIILIITGSMIIISTKPYNKND